MNKDPTNYENFRFISTQWVVEIFTLFMMRRVLSVMVIVMNEICD